MTTSYRWHSADGNDYLCGYCQSQNEMGKTHSKQTTSGKFTPRGFGKPNGDSFWKSGLKSKKGTFHDFKNGYLICHTGADKPMQ